MNIAHTFPGARRDIVRPSATAYQENMALAATRRTTRSPEHIRGRALCVVVLLELLSVCRVFGLDQPVLFSTRDVGVSKPIPTWGLDTAWYDEANLRRGAIFMGTDRVDTVRISFTPTAALVNGDLQGPQIAILNNRLNWVNRWANPGTTLYINEDAPTVDASFVGGNGYIDPVAWAAVIDVTTRRAQESGRTVEAVEPFNEPDLFRWERLADGQTFYDTLGVLKANPRFNNIRLSGGNTLNTDWAYPWYNFLQAALDEGNTHQLAGSFDNYASFFQIVRANGHHATNDEMHNVMEAIVGAEYGMQTGIWWYTAERARGEFVKASDGRRLAYAENRPNWTAAAVYRAPAGNIQAFVGESERQALPTTYRFFARDRDVFYDGHGPQRAYTVTTTGGPGYQTASHRNAETVVNITWGEDVQPAIDGRYYLVNRNSRKVMEVASSSFADGANIQQNSLNGGLNQQWDINPTPSTLGTDYSYFSIRAAHSGKPADVNNFSFDDGGNVIQWTSTGNPNQFWFLEYIGDGWFYIRSRWSGKYLDVSNAATLDGANIFQWSGNGGLNQQWRLIPVTVSSYDFVAPPMPTGVVATANAVSVELNWSTNAQTASDFDSYTVLRSTTDGGPYEIIVRGLTHNGFTDHSANKTIPYYYVVTAADKSLNHSAHSMQVEATPSGNPSLVARYAFDGDSHDVSINGNDSETHDARYVPGGVGASYLILDGGSGYVELPAEIVNFDQLTVAAWVYWNGGANWQRIFDFGNQTSAYMFLTPNSGSGVQFTIFANGVGRSLTTASALPVGQWTHVAVTLSNRTANLFINGAKAASSSFFSIRPSQFNPVLNYIGRSQYPFDPLFNGGIDDFQIFNYALSETEVAALSDVAILPPAEMPIALINPGFEDGGQAAFPDGFDIPWNDVPGWMDAGITTDSGVDGPNPWFGARDSYAAFVRGGDGGVQQLTGYTIQKGDQFTVGFWAASWNWNGALGMVKATLFYDNGGTYVDIGSYTTPMLGWVPDYIRYSNTNAVLATPESIGKLLGVRFENPSDSASFATLDDVTLTVITPDTTPPEAPTALTATPGDGSVGLDWADNAEPDLASYTVYRSISDGINYTPVATGVSSSAYTDNTVINGTVYYYVVTATDSNMNESAFSSQVSALPSVDRFERVQELIAMVDTFDLRQRKPLLAILDAALASIERDNDRSTVGQLHAFQNKVQAQVAPDEPELAGMWIAAAQEVIDAVGGSDLQLEIQVEGHRAKLRFEGVPGETYTVEVSSDLQTWTKLGTASDRGGGRFEMDDEISTSNRFYRVITE